MPQFRQNLSHLSAVRSVQQEMAGWPTRMRSQLGRYQQDLTGLKCNLSKDMAALQQQIDSWKKEVPSLRRQATQPMPDQTS